MLYTFQHVSGKVILLINCHIISFVVRIPQEEDKCRDYV